MNRELSPFVQSKRVTRILRGIAASAVGIAVLLTTALPVQADELDDQRSDLTSRIADQADAVDHASGELTAANAALAMDVLTVPA